MIGEIIEKSFEPPDRDTQSKTKDSQYVLILETTDISKVISKATKLGYKTEKFVQTYFGGHDAHFRLVGDDKIGYGRITSEETSEGIIYKLYIPASFEFYGALTSNEWIEIDTDSVPFLKTDQ